MAHDKHLSNKRSLVGVQKTEMAKITSTPGTPVTTS